MTDPRLRTIRFWLLAALAFPATIEWPNLAFFFFSAFTACPVSLFMPVFVQGCSTNCSPTYGGDLQLDAGGIANNGCDLCTALNKSYIAVFNPLFTSACRWGSGLELTGCTILGGATFFGFTAELQYNGFISQYQLNVTTNDGNVNGDVCRADWQDNLGASAPDCSAWSSLPLTLSGSVTNNVCNCSPITLELTAL